MSLAEFGSVFAEALSGSLQTTLPSPEQLSLLFRHFQALQTWNLRMNLTTIDGIRDSVYRHYAESWFLGSFVPPDCQEISDLGSGAGFPGFPIAVMRPLQRVCLIEANGRKSAFLRDACTTVPNCRVLTARSENIRSGTADCIVARAVRWTDVARFCKRKPAFLALLLGERDLDAASAGMGLLDERRTKIPWGDRRFVLSGYVSRGTD